jgi:adenylyl- and sulfurtransferase ThiI
MDREDIIRMAREVADKDKVDPYLNEFVVLTPEELERFAALVAAEKEKQIIDMLERLQERNESHNYYAYAINVIRART